MARSLMTHMRHWLCTAVRHFFEFTGELINAVILRRESPLRSAAEMAMSKVDYKKTQ
jgi:hypothetical protein